MPPPSGLLCKFCSCCHHQCCCSCHQLLSKLCHRHLNLHLPAPSTHAAVAKCCYPAKCCAILCYDVTLFCSLTWEGKVVRCTSNVAPWVFGFIHWWLVVHPSTWRRLISSLEGAQWSLVWAQTPSQCSIIFISRDPVISQNMWNSSSLPPLKEGFGRTESEEAAATDAAQLILLLTVISCELQN